MGPDSWSLSVAKQPVTAIVGKKQVLKTIGYIGDGCTMCKRSEKRTLDGIIKPKVIRGTNPNDPKLLLVFSYFDYGVTVDRVVEFIRTFHNGHILLDLPVRCGTGNVTDVQLGKCRNYLVKSFQEFKPDRIICFGGRASSAVIGSAVPAWANRWCWTTIPGFKEDTRIPIVITMDPTNIAKSRFHKQIIEDEIRWAIKGKFPNSHPRGNALVVESEADIPVVREWVERARWETGWVAHDVETDGVMFNKDFSIIACAFATPSIPDVLVWDAKALADPALLKECIEILTDPLLGKKGSNIKYDTNSWRAWKGVIVEPVVGDSRLEMKQANPDSRADLESMGFYMGINAHKTEAQSYMKWAKKQAKEDMDPDVEGVSVYAYVYKHLPLEVMLRYNALDTMVTSMVCEYSRRSLGALKATFERLILPASGMYTDIEAAGFLVDLSNIKTSKAYLEAEIAQLMPRLEKAGIDPDSTDSIRKWMEAMDLESPITTATGLASTSAKALGLIQKTPGLIQYKNEIIADVLNYRKMAKLLSAYADTLPGYVRADGRVHPSFLLDGARSGRVSCRNPALQTIPSRGPLAKLIKNCFVSRPGYTLVCSDFNILEIKVAAILSGDPEMIKAAQGDFHTETAKSLSYLAWGISPEAVEAEIRSGNKTKRDAMKIVGFSVLYGAGAESIAEKVGCSVREAQKIVNGFFAKYKRLAQWLQEQLAFAKQFGMVEIPWLDGSLGRIRPLLDISNSDPEKRGNAQRASGNTPIQSLASDICMSSAVRIHNHYKKHNIPARIVCLVHDSIICEVRDDYVDKVVRLKDKYMTDWPTQGVPLAVEHETGVAWGSTTKVDLPHD